MPEGESRSHHFRLSLVPLPVGTRDFAGSGTRDSPLDVGGVRVQVGTRHLTVNTARYQLLLIKGIPSTEEGLSAGDGVPGGRGVPPARLAKCNPPFELLPLAGRASLLRGADREKFVCCKVARGS